MSASPECPNDAIYLGQEIYEIDPARRTECVGHFDEPQRAGFGPVACIPVNPSMSKAAKPCGKVSATAGAGEVVNGQASVVHSVLGSSAYTESAAKPLKK